MKRIFAATAGLFFLSAFAAAQYEAAETDNTIPVVQLPAVDSRDINVVIEGTAPIDDGPKKVLTEEIKKRTLSDSSKMSYFKYGSAELTPAAQKILKAYAKELKDYDFTNIYVGGNTDSSGSDEFNQELSEKRALSVVEFLTAQGLPRAKMIHKGFGKKNPVASNATAEGRAKNRRVDIEVK